MGVKGLMVAMNWWENLIKPRGGECGISCEGLESHPDVVALALSLVTEHYRNLNKLQLDESLDS